jgi:hypothetical protein
MTADDVRSMLGEACDNRGKKRWAAENGVTGNYVDMVLSGSRKPGPSILNALGLQREIVYRRAA